MLKVCALLVVLLPCFSGYPTGPPPTYDVCHNMYPYEKLGHHVYSQNEYPKYGEPRDGPYDIVPEKTEYRARERMKGRYIICSLVGLAACSEKYGMCSLRFLAPWSYTF